MYTIKQMTGTMGSKLFAAKLFATSLVMSAMTGVNIYAATTGGSTGGSTGGTSTGGGSGTGTIQSVNIDLDNISSNFSDINKVAGMVVGIAILMCQLVGVVLIVWGLYGYITSRKDGDVESITTSATKLIAGFVLVGMKGILQGLGIIS